MTRIHQQIQVRLAKLEQLYRQLEGELPQAKYKIKHTFEDGTVTVAWFLDKQGVDTYLVGASVLGSQYRWHETEPDSNGSYTSTGRLADGIMQTIEVNRIGA
jgi:hypothetical protein